jgi:orotidine-5'-phosphate decarboxylase
MSPAIRESGRKRLILALDVPSLAEGRALLERLAGRVGMVKVGLELFAAEGPAAVRAVRDLGHEVFLDLKLHDIPNTVAGAVRSARLLDARMLTVHAAGGAEMLRRAAAEAGSGLTILGVTVLTSLGPEDLEPASSLGPPLEAVRRRALLAAACGCGGIVCSPREAAAVRAAVGPDVQLVIPGIRPAGGALGDQKRAATPADAIRDGADWLVVGRPISAADDPAASADAIADEIGAALAGRAP